MGVSGDLGLASSEFALISSVMYYTPETWAFVFIEMDYLSRVYWSVEYRFDWEIPDSVLKWNVYVSMTYITGGGVGAYERK